MTSIVKTRRARQSRRAGSLSQRFNQLSIFALGLLSTIIAVLALGAPALFAYITHDLPSVALLSELLDPEEGSLLSATRLYDRNGNLLMTYAPEGFETRIFVRANDNPLLTLAFITALDADFLEEEASLNTPIEKMISEWLQADEKEGVLKSLRSRLLAAQTMQYFSREQILEWAMNSVNFGNQIFGAGNAARYYFGKSIGELNLAEAAFLAAATIDPSLNPTIDPNVVEKKQQELLLYMLDQGLILEDDARDALLEGIRLKQAPAFSISLAPDFTDLALAQIIGQFGEERLARGGLEVFTSLDLSLQGEVQLLIGDHEPEIVILDSTNGQIIALLGSSRETGHTPGTILSPFVYLSAFANGYAPASLVWDIPSNVLPNLPDYENADGKFHGPINLRRALAQNYLVPTLDLLSQISAAQTWQIALESGLRSLNGVTEGNDFGLLIGGGEVSLLEVAQAYGTLSNQGLIAGQIQAEILLPNTLLEVRDSLGNILLDGTEAQTRSIIAPELAYLVTDVLSDTSALIDGTKASTLGSVNRSAALQMASSSISDEVWAVGYSAQLVVAVWAQENDLSEGQLGRLWKELFEASHQGLPIQSRLAPNGLSTMVVCVPSGMLPSADCPETRREFFLPGQEPTKRDNLYQRLSINRHSGKLATVFTPSEFVEERIFISVPAKAEEWAKQVDFAIPPADYDVIPLANQSDISAVLLNPEAFASLRGQVRIKGTLSSEQYVSYRILVGESLYPTHWIEIAQSAEIDSGEVLALWETQGLEGPYVIQLQIITSDSNIQSAFTLVTIDNQAPQLRIIDPESNQELHASEIDRLLFSVHVEDNFSIRKVTFYLDGISIGSRSDEPYELDWPVGLGDHWLRVVAIDQAGNQVQETINFEVIP